MKHLRKNCIRHSLTINASASQNYHRPISQSTITLVMYVLLFIKIHRAMYQLDWVYSSMSNKLLNLSICFQVTYQTDFFLDKNKDYVITEHQALLSASKCSFVSGLFPPLPEESSKTSKFVSIGSQFKVCFFFQ